MRLFKTNLARSSRTDSGAAAADAHVVRARGKRTNSVAGHRQDQRIVGNENSRNCEQVDCSLSSYIEPLVI